MVCGVPFPVLVYLLFPKIRDLVLPGRESVSVPKIAVHEDCDPSLAEDDIRPAGAVL